jgi:hypothetical protein
MTKKQMIDTLQQRESSLWDSLCETRNLFGEDNDMTIMHRDHWVATNRIMQLLDIPTLNELQLKQLTRKAHNRSPA